MGALSKRDEIINYINSIDDSKLEVFYNRFKEDLKVVGQEPDGTAITLGDLKSRVEESAAQYKNGQVTDIDDLINESENW